MLVRFLGLQVVLGEDLTVGDLFAKLKKSDGKMFDHYNSQREMHTDKVGSYHVAVVVSIKDHQTLMRRRREGNHWTVKPDEAQPDAEMVDFNFLALHERTGRGLYQHYRGSLSTRLLENILARRHNEMINERRGEWIKTRIGSAAQTTLAQESRKLHKGQLHINPIIRQEDLGSLIKSLDEVTALQVDFVGISDDAKTFQPLSPQVKSSRTRFSFKPNVAGPSIAGKLLKLVGRDRDGHRAVPEIEGGRVEGVQNGIEVAIDFDSLPIPVFATYDFDQTASEFRPDDFTKAYLLKELVKVCNDNKAIFERPARS